MKRVIFILIGLLIVGALAFTGYQYYKGRQEDIAELNKKKEALVSKYSDLHMKEIELRRMALSLDLERELLLVDVEAVANRNRNPLKVLAPTSGISWDVLLNPYPSPLAAAKYCHANQDLDSIWCEIDSYINDYEAFFKEYHIYKYLLKGYNNLANEINISAGRLGEPSVLLEDAYDPIIR